MAEPFEAIIALGGGVSPAGELHPASVARTDGAARLYMEELAPKLILTGGAGHEVIEADAMQLRAVELGVPIDDTMVELFSRNTIGNAALTKKHILKPMSLNRLLVVTSLKHEERAGQIFEHVLGPDYEVQTLGVHVPNSRVGKEKLSCFWTDHLLRGTEPGNEEAILERLRTYHPNYSVESGGRVALRNVMEIGRKPARVLGKSLQRPKAA